MVRQEQTESSRQMARGHPFAEQAFTVTAPSYWLFQSTARSALSREPDGTSVRIGGMNRPMAWRLLAMTVIVALVATACGGAVVESGAGNEPGFGTCDDTQELVSLLESGLPAYDFDPSPDLNALVEISDLVVTGSMYMAVRDDDTGRDGESWTRITGDAAILDARNDAIRDQFLADESFIVRSFWASSGEADPLEDPVIFEGGTNRFIAFLGAGSPGEQFEVLVEGLHVACDSQGDSIAVIEGPPPGVSGSVDDISEAVLAIVDPPPVRNEGDVFAVEHRVLVEDVPIGDPWSSQVVVADDVWRAYGNDIELADNELYFEFVVAESGSCPLGPLAGVEFDSVSEVLFPVFESDSEPDRSCTADANPHAVVVAMARSNLPAETFSISTTQFGLPQGLEPTPVDVGEAQ